MLESLNDRHEIYAFPSAIQRTIGGESFSAGRGPYEIFWDSGRSRIKTLPEYGRYVFRGGIRFPRVSLGYVGAVSAMPVGGYVLVASDIDRSVAFLVAAGVFTSVSATVHARASERGDGLVKGVVRLEDSYKMHVIRDGRSFMFAHQDGDGTDSAWRRMYRMAAARASCARSSLRLATCRVPTDSIIHLVNVSYVGGEVMGCGSGLVYQALQEYSSGRTLTPVLMAAGYALAELKTRRWSGLGGPNVPPDLVRVNGKNGE